MDIGGVSINYECSLNKRGRGIYVEALAICGPCGA